MKSLLKSKNSTYEMLNIIPPGNESDDPRSSRILDRSRRFDQSRGVFNIKRRYSSSTISNFRRCVYANDWFHTLLHWSVCRLVVLISLLYLLTIFLFGILYYILGKQCDLAMSEFIEALFFSMETMMTIGYGTDDIFFRSCKVMFILITSQSIVACLLDAFCFGMLYARLARGTTRAASIIFSNKAIVQRIRGRFYFMFRVGELRKHQLIEAHVRCYAIRHVIDKMGNPIHFQTFTMRLMHPDDELGSMLFLPIPQLVVHCIDAWSPLSPPYSNTLSNLHNSSTDYLFPDVLQRIQDIDSGNRDPKEILACDKCGIVFRNAYYLKQHVTNIQSKSKCATCIPPPCNEEQNHTALDIPIKSLESNDDEVHIHSDLSYISTESPGQTTKEQLEWFWHNSKLEVVILIEGIDSGTSDTIQARHSYSYLNGEIISDHHFASIVRRDETDSCEIDFSKFHDVLPIGDHDIEPQSHS